MPSLRQVAFILPLFLLPALSLPAPEPIQLISRGSAPTVAETSYQCFRGTKFPSQWLPWDTLLAINKPAISRGNTPENTENIISSIQSVANAAGILP